MTGLAVGSCHDEMVNYTPVFCVKDPRIRDLVTSEEIPREEKFTLKRNSVFFI